MSGGCMKKTHDRLVATGMPAEVDGCIRLGEPRKVDGWCRYWGTAGAIYPEFGLSGGAEGFKTTCREEDGHEIIESENGSITRQVIDNDITYSMPEFIRFPVRDRESWEFFKDRSTPKTYMPRDEMEALCRELDTRDTPLCVGAWGTYGFIRGRLGPQAASLMFYDDPELIHEMMDWLYQQLENEVFPLIERLKPEVVMMAEDCCYNHGMLIKPQQFHEFFGKYYDAVSGCAYANGAEVVIVDTDGNAMEFTGVAQSHGTNAICPNEVKAGNDLFALREKHPKFLLFGGLEKETVNEGNHGDIEREIMSKVPPLLKLGGYFPNGDHGIQPPVTFPNLCKFMTLLHEVCGNPEGEFPRM
ncbi:MAG: uroporphyrinogen decarboxylase family protein [Candidatus Latescibacteria bacterium]|nr:uroporphyrinogen decarboxylase family protein [Candidatus Latescibacterota bacterium]